MTVRTRSNFATLMAMAMGFQITTAPALGQGPAQSPSQSPSQSKAIPIEEMVITAQAVPRPQLETI